MSARGPLANPGSPDAKEMYAQIKRGAQKFTGAFDCEALPPGMRAWMKSQVAVVLANAKRYLDPEQQEPSR